MSKRNDRTRRSRASKGEGKILVHCAYCNKKLYLGPKYVRKRNFCNTKCTGLMWREENPTLRKATTEQLQAEMERRMEAAAWQVE